MEMRQLEALQHDVDLLKSRFAELNSRLLGEIDRLERRLCALELRIEKKIKSS